MPAEIIVSVGGLASGDDGKLLFSNASFVTVAREEGADDALLHPDALRSFAVDQFAEQVANGGFAQYVFNSRWDPETVSHVEAGLEGMGADEVLAMFRRLVAVVDAGRADGRLESFLQSAFFGENAFRDDLNAAGAGYFEAEPNLVARNAAWLRAHPDLRPVEVPEMFAIVERIVGHPVEQY